MTQMDIIKIFTTMQYMVYTPSYIATCGQKDYGTTAVSLRAASSRHILQSLIQKRHSTSIFSSKPCLLQFNLQYIQQRYDLETLCVAKIERLSLILVSNSTRIQMWNALSILYFGSSTYVRSALRMRLLGVVGWPEKKYSRIETGMLLLLF